VCTGLSQAAPEKNANGPYSFFCRPCCGADKSGGLWTAQTTLVAQGTTQSLRPRTDFPPSTFLTVLKVQPHRPSPVPIVVSQELVEPMTCFQALSPFSWHRRLPLPKSSSSCAVRITILQRNHNTVGWQSKSVSVEVLPVRIMFTHCGSVVNLGGVVSGCGEGGCRQKRLIRWRKIPGGCHWCEKRVGGCPARPDYRTAMCKNNSCG
jgi:hypothetical protein